MMRIIKIFLAMVPLCTTVSAIANQSGHDTAPGKDSVQIERSACENNPHCEHPYRYEDFKAYDLTYSPTQQKLPYIVQLTDDVQINKVKMLKGDLLHFDRSGNLTDIEFHRHTDFKGVPRKVNGQTPDSSMRWKTHPNGTVKSMRMRRAHIHEATLIDAGAIKLFDDQGQHIRYEYPPGFSDMLSSDRNQDEREYRAHHAYNMGDWTIRRGTILTLGGNNEVLSVVLAEDQWVKGRFYPALTEFRINSEHEITSQNFYPNKKRLSPDGSPYANSRFDFLDAPLTIGPINLPVGTLVERQNNEINAVHLMEKTQFCGSELEAMSVSIAKHRNNLFTYGFKIKNDRTINGFPLKGTSEYITFWENCKPATAILSHTKLMNGFPEAPNDRFRADPDGTVTTGKLNSNWKYHDLEISAGTRIRFDTPFSVGPRLFSKEGIVTDGDRQYQAGWMHIYRHGVIALGRLAVDTEIDGEVYPEGTELKFDESGNLIEVISPCELCQLGLYTGLDCIRLCPKQ